MERPIGVIDSGVGGLTVVKEMIQHLPNESVLYLGDDKRCPYGSRTTEEVHQFTMEMVQKLATRDIKLLVIACNTATAIALESVVAAYNFPVIGVIVPGARASVNSSASHKIAVLGTTRTIQSEAYTNEIKKIAADAMIYPLDCPEFVPLVESGQYQSESVKEIVHERLRHLEHADFDTAILGCTHYPLLEHHIESGLPSHVKIISSAMETVKDVERVLGERCLFAAKDAVAKHIFLTTGNSETFKTIVEEWLALKNPNVQHIQLP